jgi:molybdenum cofactor cytidylyltransferase
MTHFVSGLILAAGASRRFGRAKQLLPYRDTTMLGWVVRQAAAATRLTELVVVLGGAAAEILAAVDLSPARVIQAPDFASGCAASYRAGIATLDPRAAAVVVLLGDQPGVSADIIDRVVDSWQSDPAELVVTSYRNRIGHPMIFDRACFPELSRLTGDKAAWKIVDARGEGVRRVDVDLPYPMDVNTPDDYARLVADTHA